MKILIIRLGAIGDVVLTSSTVLNLKLSYPESDIYFLTRPLTAPIVRNIPGVDEIIEFPQKATAVDLFRMGEYLDKINFDMVIDLHGNLRSKYLSTHVVAPYKIQYFKRRWERMSAVRFHKINPNPPHTIDIYNDAVLKLGGKAYCRRPVLKPEGLPEPIFEDRRKKIVAIAPGASYLTKQWPVRNFIEAAQTVTVDLGVRVLWLLTDNDKKIADDPGLRSSSDIKFLINEPLDNIPAIISECDLLLSNDSAMAHIGSSVGTPVLALFGPTHPTLGFAPRGYHDRIMQVDEYCRPCSLHGKRKCYRDKQYCFKRITPNDVVTEIEAMLNDDIHNRKALFIDRDGTLIIDKLYLDNPALVEHEPGSIEALILAKEAGYALIVVSNQSGVARGYFDEAAVDLVNSRVKELYAQAGVEIDAFYYCPHYRKGTVPEYAIDCDCRKPRTGMIEQASAELKINPYASYVIGDKLSDIRLGYLMGGQGILVRTGFGTSSEKDLQETDLFQPEYIADNLLDAVKYITEL